MGDADTFFAKLSDNACAYGMDREKDMLLSDSRADGD